MVSIKPVLCAAAIATFLSSPALADVSRESNQTTEVAWHNYKLHLKNFNPLTVHSTNDSDGEDELHSVSITLSSAEYEHNGQTYPVQFDRRTHTRQDLWGSQGRVANTAYLPVIRGTNVTLSNRGRQTPDDLWVVTKPTLARYNSQAPELFFTITIVSRELDCARQRVCRRGDTGTWTFRGSIPWGSDLQANYRETCSASNTFKLQYIDRTLSIIPPASLNNPWEKTPPLVNVSGSGPRLGIFNADICVTRDRRGSPRSQTPTPLRDRAGKVEQIPEKRRRVLRDLKRPQVP